MNESTIFEGTNEINRLLTVGMLLKCAAQNRLPLMGSVMQLMAGRPYRPRISRRRRG
jgi:hypothetical protein